MFVQELLQLGMLGWPEIIMILVVVLILFGAKKLPELSGGMATFKRAVQDIIDELARDPRNTYHPNFSSEADSMNNSEEQKPSNFLRHFTLWIAQGFGIGRIPKAPGTFGSVLGVGWFALLLWIGGIQPWLAGVLLLASIFASVSACEAGEKILGKKDPGSIVIDEIIAVPVCFLGWVFHLTLQLGQLPSLDFFFGATTWYLALGVFLAFRFFDIVKPWPVRQSQDVPRGWGVVLDDLLAAVYVNLVILLVHLALQAV